MPNGVIRKHGHWQYSSMLSISMGIEHFLSSPTNSFGDLSTNWFVSNQHECIANRTVRLLWDKKKGLLM